MNMEKQLERQVEAKHAARLVEAQSRVAMEAEKVVALQRDNLATLEREKALERRLHTTRCSTERLIENMFAKAEEPRVPVKIKRREPPCEVQKRTCAQRS